MNPIKVTKELWLFFFPGQCYEVNINHCKNHTAYSLTTLPNAFGHTTLLEVTASSSKYPEIFEDQCYGYAKDFWCSVYNPECKNGQPVLPCKQYCQGIDINSLRFFPNFSKDRLKFSHLLGMVESYTQNVVNYSVLVSLTITL